MKIKVIQPPYPHRAEDTPAAVDFMIAELRRCSGPLDLVLLPECCNAPSGCGDYGLLKKLAAENTEKLIEAVKETAIRCHTLVGINLYMPDEASGKFRNATVMFNASGEVAARYDKLHLPISEYSNPVIDHSYIEKAEGPYFADIEGVRYAFLTCYDMYYTEMFNRIAAGHPDIVIVCSLQRGERHDILETEAKTCAFLCNAYLVRSSYYMGEGARTGSCSMVVAPDGVVLENFGNSLGSFECEIENVHYKYARANGYGQPDVPNDVFQSRFRAPWMYRAAGSGVIPGASCMVRKHLSARDGFTPGAPANTVPAVGLAIAMGAGEIRITVHCTSDGVPVLCDNVCAPVTDGSAVIGLTLEELKQLDPGKAFGAAYAGVSYASLEELFSRFPRRTVFDLVLPPFTDAALCEKTVQTVRALALRFDCLDHVCLSSADTEVLKIAERVYGEAPRRFVYDGTNGPAVEKALETRCSGLYVPSVTKELADSAHANGLSVFAPADSAEEASALFLTGADCIVTAQYLEVRNKTGIA